MKPEKLGFVAMLLMPLVALADVGQQNGNVLPACHAPALHVAGEPCPVPAAAPAPGEEGLGERIICDGQGRIARRIDAAGNVTEMIHHPRTGKLILVLDQRLGTALVYHYDDDGKLISARDASGRLFNFDYGRTTTIQRLVETGGEGAPRRTLAFKYGAYGKPVEIRLLGVGKIDVEYDRHGEISRVGSSKGAELTLQIMEVFRYFLAVVRPVQAPGD